MKLLSGQTQQNKTYFDLKNLRNPKFIPKGEVILKLHECQDYEICCPCIDSLDTQGGAANLDNCFCFGNFTVGWREMRKTLLAQNFKEDFVTDEWVKHHYRMIVWKLYSIQRKLQFFHPSKRLSIENIKTELEYRYYIEFTEGKRSVLQRIVEKDEGSNSHMILLVGEIILKNNVYEVELSDGWNSVYFEVKNEQSFSLGAQTITNNQLFLSLITRKKLATGTKIHIANMKVLKTVKIETGEKPPEGSEEAPTKDKTYVEVSYNSISRA